MPLRSTTSCELTFDDTLVQAGNVLGKLGGGLSLGMSAVNAGRLNMAMGAVGLSQACLEESIGSAASASSSASRSPGSSWSSRWWWRSRP